MYKDTNNRIEYIKNRYSILLDNVDRLKKEKENLIRRRITLDKEIKLITDSEIVYKKVLDKLYDKNLDELKELINNTLKYIFDDREYSIEFELSDKYGKSLSILLKDKDLIVDLKDGIGNGLRAVISFVLQYYYISNFTDNPIIFTDEYYSVISEEYVERFFEVVNKFCKEGNLKLVMITHDNRFMDYADNIYVMDNGVLSKKDKLC